MNGNKVKVSSKVPQIHSERDSEKALRNHAIVPKFNFPANRIHLTRFDHLN